MRPDCHVRAGLFPFPLRALALSVTAIRNQDGEIALGQLTVHTLIDATDSIRPLQDQDPPPSGFGIGRLAGLAVRQRVAMRNCSDNSSFFGSCFACAHLHEHAVILNEDAIH